MVASYDDIKIEQLEAFNNTTEGSVLSLRVLENWQRVRTVSCSAAPSAPRWRAEQDEDYAIYGRNAVDEAADGCTSLCALSDLLRTLYSVRNCWLPNF